MKKTTMDWVHQIKKENKEKQKKTNKPGLIKDELDLKTAMSKVGLD